MGFMHWYNTPIGYRESSILYGDLDRRVLNILIVTATTII